ncbi:carbamoyl-phosphate synthase, small subunit [Heliomicrobium modesticaldum Ice1]|uniref:Carbamoyl phosphate synthase small chain n=1 Tax=Heliobacterium modesticaldum (strain ATCC 51547 / Ice1) TaxID=498761 RepID=B0TGQ5_HELMI|nr:glutamine-hydrolyzing carbamoyl-phosphate synthase small subunit [Heliomicrobium modesticaldum]ABZ84666.1 carbamoyl-phosphate synthase, small subunit [Heliomicrobium modesticaldum Ice1]
MEKGYLILEDGSVWEGQAFGARGQRPGEVVFNTGMTGYQELLTDPSYCGQIVVMTYPLIGNYGINEEDFESRQPFLRGFIVREWAEIPSNWRSRDTINGYLKQAGVIGLAGVDTRALTRRLRSHGTMRGIIATGDVDRVALVQQAQQAPHISGQPLVDEVTVKERSVMENDGFHVALLDYGAKDNIARSLHLRGCKVTILPARTTAAEVLALNPDGIMLSNGPGDPRDVPYAVEAVKALLGKKPVFGICLGHQIIGLAVGAKAYKLPFGHRGSNHPVKDLATGRVYITSQNHGFVIDGDSVPAGVIVSHINMNDGSVEGLAFTDMPAFSVQYHPEACPGPDDSGYLFDRFIDLMKQTEGRA